MANSSSSSCTLVRNPHCSGRPVAATLIMCLQAGPKVWDRLCWAVTSNMEGWLVEVKVEVRNAPELVMVVENWLSTVQFVDCQLTWNWFGGPASNRQLF